MIVSFLLGLNYLFYFNHFHLSGLLTCFFFQLDNFPPKISGNSTFIVAVEQVSIYDFTVEDIDDNITVGVVGGLSYDATLVGYKGAYTFSWTIPKVDNVSLTFFAMDSFNATSILSVQLQVCACRNGGNCTSTGLSYIEAQSIIMRCDCPKGMYILVIYPLCLMQSLQHMMVHSVRRITMDV